MSATAAASEKNRILAHNTGPSAVWSSASEHYDEVSRGIADAIEHGINRLEPRAGEHILDIATGTGWTARRLAERGFRVTAGDFAEGVVDAGRDLARRRNLDVTFDISDAEAMPYADRSFDALISTFGVMFVQKPEAAARELARICKPGGRLVLVNWTPDGNVFEMFKIMRAYMPQAAGTPAPSPFEWGKASRIRELLGGDFDLEFETGTSFYREPSGEAAWETFSRSYGPLRSLAGKLDAEKRRSLKRDFVAFHDRFATEMGICVPRDYLLVRGVRF